MECHGAGRWRCSWCYARMISGIRSSAFRHGEVLISPRECHECVVRRGALLDRHMLRLMIA